MRLQTVEFMGASMYAPILYASQNAPAGAQRHAPHRLRIQAVPGEEEEEEREGGGRG